MSQFATLPTKRYFTITEVCELCEIKPSVLKYWEQEFAMTRPVPRRFYQRHEVQLLRRIQQLLYTEGYSMSAVRNQLGIPSAVEPEAHAAVRISADELAAMRDDLTRVKNALDQALANTRLS